MAHVIITCLGSLHRHKITHWLLIGAACLKMQKRAEMLIYICKFCYKNVVTVVTLALALLAQLGLFKVFSHWPRKPRQEKLPPLSTTFLPQILGCIWAFKPTLHLQSVTEKNAIVCGYTWHDFLGSSMANRNNAIWSCEHFLHYFPDAFNVKKCFQLLSSVACTVKVLGS